MGSAASIQEELKKVSTIDLSKVLAQLGADEQRKLKLALEGPTSVPTEGTQEDGIKSNQIPSQVPSGTSTFQIAKLERIYKMKDFNATGTVNEDDFVLWGQKVCEISGIKYTSEKKQNWIKAYKTFFQGDPKNAKEWIDGVLAWQAADPTCIKTSTKVNMALFECIDSGKNGKISWSEFEAFIGALGVSADDAKVAFEMIDANKDGVLSKEELCVACARYYFDVEDTPYKHFYGKYDQVEQIPSD